MNAKSPKTSQLIMVWLLPIIVIGGLFYPLLGYLVLGMMIVLLVLSYYRGRFWCANYCPRGSFLDLVLSRLSLRRKIPRLFLRPAFRWAFVAVFLVFFAFQIVSAEKTVAGIGFVFVRMCLITTVAAILLGVPIHQRTWCAFCPMGTLQGALGKLSAGGRKAAVLRPPPPEDF